MHRTADAVDPWLADLRAWTEVLPRDARFTGLTAARLHGLWLPNSLQASPWRRGSRIGRLGRGARGGVVLRQAVALSDVRTESAWETILREFHRIAEAPVVPQHHVHDDHGNWLARGDLWFPGTKVLHEYDGGRPP